jgi:hypothetical protein
MDEKTRTPAGNPNDAERHRDMGTREIPSSDWYDYFSRFNQEHDGEPSTLRILSPGFGAQDEARNLPLEGVVSGHGKTREITVTLGRGLSTHIEHVVTDPVHVWIQLGPDGRETAIDIESEDGIKTILEILPASESRSRR